MTINPLTNGEGGVEVDNTDALKVGAAVIGGYLLGRTKKAKAVVGLALWATGNRYRARDLARDGMVRLAQNPEVSKMSGELAAPLLAAGRRAALAALEAQTTRLTQGLTDRTSALTDLGEGVVPRGEQDEPEPEAQAETDDEAEAEAEAEPEPEPEQPRRRPRAPASGSGTPRARSGEKGRSAGSGEKTRSAASSGGKSRSAGSGARRTASSAQRPSGAARGGGSATQKRAAPSRRTR